MSQVYCPNCGHQNIVYFGDYKPPICNNCGNEILDDREDEAEGQEDWEWDNPQDPDPRDGM